MFLKMMNKKYAIFLLVIVFILAALSALGSQEVSRMGLDPERIYSLLVPATTHWTDTGFDVKGGEELYFRASGAISLQQGNPVAFPCSPNGLDLKTVQQPLPEENIGALIGKIVLLLSVEVDEETGKETRNEIIREFYIGKNKRFAIPIDGRLYLGINELVVADNSGEFRVEMQLLE
jgi:hypothetical protein